ncbi:nose resistant to fluoxetine protein 6-like isoform X2 [Tachypleus tridentatus]|uniref:nose resistant to fluoxetine protein 6-like isoform X2 n=1 Tax=Tachypleus tridentatus TaxID=6853 RepID=UPI003FD3498E
MNAVSSRGVYSLFCLVYICVGFANPARIENERQLIIQTNNTSEVFETLHSQTLTSRYPGNLPSPTTGLLRSTKSPTISTKTPGHIEDITSITSTESVLDIWMEAEKKSKKLVASLYRDLLPKFIRAGGKMKISGQCMSSLLKLVFGIRKLKNWSIRMVDAMGKLPSGFLEGTFMALGAYDECVKIRVLNRYGDNEEFRGKYCLIEGNVHLPKKPKRVSAKTKALNTSLFESGVFLELSHYAHFFYYFNLMFGVCVPSTCTESDVKEMVKNVDQHILAKTSVSSCHVEEPVRLDASQTAVVCVLAVFGLLVTIGTSLDLLRSYGGKQKNNSFTTKIGNNGKVFQSLVAFSLYSNGKHLFDLSQKPGSLPALNGIRFITITWVILCHTYAWAILITFRSLNDLNNSTEDLAFEVILNGWVSVDTFFFLSGVLVTYVTLKHLTRSGGKMNYGLFLFHRYWRLTPPLMMVISLLILMEGLGSGPLWDMHVRSETERCKESWWAVLLYISNWRDHKYRCLPHLWYLCVDMQLHIISLLILIPLFWKPLIGFLVLFVLVLGSSIAVGVITSINDYFPTVLHLAPDPQFNENIVKNIYWKPYTHMGPFCVGIIVGYLILNHRDVVIRPFLRLIMWTIAIICSVSTLYGAYEFNRGNLPPPWEAGLYASLFHTGWAVGLGWLTFACTTSRGGLRLCGLPYHDYASVSLRLSGVRSSVYQP